MPLDNPHTTATRDAQKMVSKSAVAGCHRPWTSVSAGLSYTIGKKSLAMTLMSSGPNDGSVKRRKCKE